MADAAQLRAIADGLAKQMSSAASVPTPTCVVLPGSAHVAGFALADKVAHFEVPTLFGYDVRVTVSPVGVFDGI